MKIVVIGAGAIGGLVAGYLKLKKEDVSLVSHPAAIAAIKENGLQISGIRGEFRVTIDIRERLTSQPDLAILATKTQDIEAALKDNLNFIRSALILTTQNGIRAEDIVAQYIPKEKIISSIVMFGATNLQPGKIVHNFEGNWIAGRPFAKNDAGLAKISKILGQIFPVLVTEDLAGMKYLKIFVNANNCIPAILGLSMQEAFADLDISCLSIAIWKEGLKIVNKSGINLVSLPDFPKERLLKLSSLAAEEAAKIFSGIMLSLSKEPLYGSVLQSIKRDRPSEIDYINGEFVTMAQENNLRAPLNKKLVELVHRVEETGKFLTKNELLEETKGLFNPAENEQD